MSLGQQIIKTKKRLKIYQGLIETAQMKHNHLLQRDLKVFTNDWEPIERAAKDLEKLLNVKRRLIAQLTFLERKLPKAKLSFLNH